jgi:hypothetical protein
MKGLKMDEIQITHIWPADSQGKHYGWERGQHGYSIIREGKRRYYPCVTHKSFVRMLNYLRANAVRVSSIPSHCDQYYGRYSVKNERIER